MIPLATLAAELDRTLPDTAALVGDALQTDPASGVRVVPAHICRQLIQAHHQQQAAQEQAQRAHAQRQAAESKRQAAQYAAEQQAREARAERQREILRQTPELTALEVMVALDANPDDRTPAGRAFDEIMAAERQGNVGVMYRFNPTT